MFASRKKTILLCFVLAAMTAMAFSPVLFNDFIQYDDPSYVLKNKNVLSGLTFKDIGWAFTSFKMVNYHPITFLSHMLDVELFGLNPAGHHFSSLVIHIANVVLLFLVLAKITRQTVLSAIVAALFAVHPMRVESVAWIAERKDVLCAFFGFLTIWFYSEWVRTRKSTTYVLALIWFVFGLLSKPMLVTFPVVLLLLDFWPLARQENIGKRIQDKIPFLVLALALSAITVYTQKNSGAVAPLVDWPVMGRIANALTSYVVYLIKAVVPVNLAVLYPLKLNLPLWMPVAASFFITAVTVLAWKLRAKAPYLLTGWLWYLVTLLPVIGLIQVGIQARADRYTYIPLIGFSIMVVWGADALLQRVRYKRVIAFGLIGAVILGLFNATLNYIPQWKDTLTLFSHALQVTENNYTAHSLVANELLILSRPDAAYPHYVEAYRIQPKESEFLRRQCIALVLLGRYDELIECAREYLERKPESSEIHNLLGFALLNKDRFKEAESQFQEALRLDPENKEIKENLVIARSKAQENVQPNHGMH